MKDIGLRHGGEKHGGGRYVAVRRQDGDFCYFDDTAGGVGEVG